MSSRCIRIAQKWRKIFREVCPDETAHTRGRYAWTLATMDVETDAQLRELQEDFLKRHSNVGEKSLRLHSSYIQRTEGKTE